MTRWTGKQIHDAALRAGFSDNRANGEYSPAEIIAAIALAESGGDDQAVNPSSGAAGVYQILPSVWGNQISEADMHDLVRSSAFVYNTISHYGTYFGAWVQYNNGVYLLFLPLPGVAGPPSAPPAGAPPGGNSPGGQTGGSNKPGTTSATGGNFLGIPTPTTDELQRAATVAAVALLAVVMIIVGIYGLATGSAEKIVPEVATKAIKGEA